MTEQPTGKSESADAKAVASDFKSLDDLKSMSLGDMEKELSSKDYNKAPVSQDKDQTQQDSDTSDDHSDDESTDNANQSSETEQGSDEENSSQEDSSSETDDSSESTTDNQKDKLSSLEERLAKQEKQYKDLQAEFTRRSQELKELKASKEDNSEKAKEQETKLSQLRKRDPEAAAALEALIAEEVSKRVQEHVKPLEDTVTLRTRQENVNKFNKAVEEFKSSPLKELEVELVAIINDNPSEWQRTIWDKGDAFESLKKELFYRHQDKVARLTVQANKQKESSSVKKDRLKEGQVGTKTKVTQPTRDVMSDSEFKNLSLAEMEKRLPKVRR